MANNYANCQRCGASKHSGTPISCVGLCPSCGERQLLDNIEGLVSKSGPAFERWRTACIEKMLAMGGPHPPPAA